MKLVAFVLTGWAAVRWFGFVLGVGRLGRLDGRVRREARRTVVNRGAINVFVTVFALFLWAEASHLRFSPSFVGFLAACMMCSLAVGVAAAFMQPEQRTPLTLSICRLRWAGRPGAGSRTP